MNISMQEFKTYKPSVGDEIYLAKDASPSRKNVVASVEVSVVASVGNKYFTIEAMPQSKFHIDGKEPHEAEKYFPMFLRLYPSEAVYNEQVLGTALLKELSLKFEYNARKSMETRSIEDIKTACKILGVSTEI